MGSEFENLGSKYGLFGFESTGHKPKRVAFPKRKNFFFFFKKKKLLSQDKNKKVTISKKTVKII